MDGTGTPGPENRARQKYLGDKGLVVLMTYLSAFIPLSTDLYLPALPRMAAVFDASPGVVNLTLIFFFLFYSAGALFWGPLSDKYGRKPILLVGLILYTVSSILCALAGDVYQLILYRILQAFGTGAATAIATAVVKDVYAGRKRESVLALVQSISMIAPVVAPVIGAFILRFSTWQGVFIALAAFGALAVAGALLMQETIPERNDVSILRSLGQLIVVAKNPAFSYLLITFTIVMLPFMAYVSASSYIYIEWFGLSEQTYSYYFAVSSLFCILGPLLYMKISLRFQRNAIIRASFIASIVSGLLICTVGGLQPWLFSLAFLPAPLALGVNRPPSTNLMLEQQQNNTGAASSLINSVCNLFGCLGIVLISFNWANRILVLGVISTVVSVFCLILWLAISRKPFVRQ